LILLSSFEGGKTSHINRTTFHEVTLYQL